MAKFYFNVSFFILVLLGAWIFPDYSFSERTTFPNPQGESGAIAQTSSLKIDCMGFLDETLQKLCEYLKLKDLPEIEGLKIADLSSFVLAAQEPIGIFTDPESFKKITKNPEQLVRRLGFEKLDQLEQVQPAPVLIVKWVSLEKLANFQDGMVPEKIMKFADKFIVPLVVGEQALSSLTFGLFREENQWKWTRRGAPGRIRNIYKIRNGAQELVEIPGLNLQFLVVPGRSPVDLMPLSDVKSKNFELKAGEVQPANQVFLGLKEEAKRIIQELQEPGRPVVR